jgi:hypothetical protein
MTRLGRIAIETKRKQDTEEQERLEKQKRFFHLRSRVCEILGGIATVEFQIRGKDYIVSPSGTEVVRLNRLICTGLQTVSDIDEKIEVFSWLLEEE